MSESLVFAFVLSGALGLLLAWPLLKGALKPRGVLRSKPSSEKEEKAKEKGTKATDRRTEAWSDAKECPPTLVTTFRLMGGHDDKGAEARAISAAIHRGSTAFLPFERAPPPEHSLPLRRDQRVPPASIPPRRWPPNPFKVFPRAPGGPPREGGKGEVIFEEKESLHEGSREDGGGGDDGDADDSSSGCPFSVAVSPFAGACTNASSWTHLSGHKAKHLSFASPLRSPFPSSSAGRSSMCPPSQAAPPSTGVAPMSVASTSASMSANVNLAQRLCMHEVRARCVRGAFEVLLGCV